MYNTVDNHSLYSVSQNNKNTTEIHVEMSKELLLQHQEHANPLHEMK
jgi:hypothetical protein